MTTEQATNERTCRKCGAIFAGRQCSACIKIWRLANPDKVKAQSRTWRANNPEYSRAKNRAWQKANPRVRTLRKHGLTLECFAKMLVAQGGVCAICRSTAKPGKTLCVDHDHATGAVRALLCIRCNGLVGAHEHPLSLAARQYIAEHA